MAVDVVVINYHTDDLLHDFVDSYQEHSFDGCTLTIVDVEVQKMQRPSSWMTPYHIDYYAPVVANSGYGRACNHGASLGHNGVILLANADTLLTDGIAQCYEALIGNPEWGVLGPRQIDDQGLITMGGVFGSDRAPYLRGWQEQDVDQYSQIREDALSVAGSLYFIKRSVWNELTECSLYQQYQPGVRGAFLETPHYFDETFCSYHARAHGYKVVYYGPVQMTHLWHRSSVLGGWADQQFVKSRAMFREACYSHGILCE